MGTLTSQPPRKKSAESNSRPKRPPPLKPYGFTVTLRGLLRLKSNFVSGGIFKA